MELDEDKLDTLREIAHIGAGNASKSLSELTDNRVGVEFPKIEKHNVKDIPELFESPGKTVTSVSINVGVENNQGGEEDLGELLLLMDWDSTKKLAEILTEEEVGEPPLKGVQKSSIGETGNILAGSCLSAITEYVDLKLLEGVPEVNTDLLGAVMDEHLLEIAKKDNDLLVFQTNFTLENEKAEAYFVILFKPEKYKVILNRLEVDQ
ncbi:MAG: chemotaxis protein CheC [Candidatus Nanohalobium sp.]